VINIGLYITLLVCTCIIVYFFSSDDVVTKYAIERYNVRVRSVFASTLGSLRLSAQTTGVNNIGICFFDLCTVVAFLIYGLRLHKFQKQVSMHAKLQSSLRTVSGRGARKVDQNNAKNKDISSVTLLAAQHTVFPLSRCAYSTMLVGHCHPLPAHDTNGPVHSSLG